MAPDRLTIEVPPGLTARQAESLARLLESIAEGRWSRLAVSFERLADAAVSGYHGPPGELLASVVVELRRWRRRQPDLAQAEVRSPRL